jgi:hypothetical protein
MTNIEQLLQENQQLKDENEKLKNSLYIPKLVIKVFDYFIWLNQHISKTIEEFEDKV